MKTPTQPKSTSTAASHAEKKRKGASTRAPKTKTAIKSKPSAWSNLISSTPSHQWSPQDPAPKPEH
jgi:hypothetical protein